MKKILSLLLSFSLIISPVGAAHASEVGMGGYIRVLLGMANGVVGSSILLSCRLGAKNPSITAYFAGSLVYVASEIMGGNNKKKSIQENSKALDEMKSGMKEGGDYQKAAVLAQLENEEDNLSHITKKRKWMLATKVTYGIATGLAIAEAATILDNFIPAGCLPFIAAAPQTAVGTAISFSYIAAQGYATGGGIMGAGLAAGGVALAAQFTAGLQAMSFVQDKVVTMLNFPAGRIAFFGAAALAVQMLDAELANEEVKSKKKIADLRKVVAQFDLADNNLGEGSVQSSQGVSPLAGNNGQSAFRTRPINLLPTASSLPKSCISNRQGGGLEFSEQACRTPIRVPRPGLSANLNLPTLRSGLNTANDMAQAVANGDFATAEIAAQNLGSMASRIDEINKKLLNDMNKKLQEKGEKPTSFDKEIEKRVADFNAEIAKRGSLGGNTLASTQNAGNGGVSTIGNKVKSDESRTGEGVRLDTSSDPVATSGSGITEPEMTEPTAEVTTALNENYGEFEIPENDISKKSEVSIFQQLSNRYLMNYTKIFEKKKPAYDQPLLVSPTK